MNAENPFGELATPSDLVQQRARQRQWSAQKRWGALLGAGLAGLPTALVVVPIAGGIAGLIEALTAMAVCAFGGALMLLLGGVYIGKFQHDWDIPTESFVTWRPLGCLTLAGALPGGLFGLLLGAIGAARTPETLAWMVGTSAVATLIGAVVGWRRAGAPPDKVGRFTREWRARGSTSAEHDL
jgi:hypothetical protein